MVTGGSNSQGAAHSGTDTIFHYGQPVAIVVAEDQAIARDAASRVVVSVEEAPARLAMAEQRSSRTTTSASCPRSTRATSTPRWPTRR